MMKRILLYWRQLSLKFRTMSGFLTILGVTTVFLIISNIQLQQLNSSTELMYKNQQIQMELQHIENTHLQWLIDLDRYLLNAGKAELQIQLDPTQCALGKWLSVSENELFEFRGTRAVLDKLIPLHKALHESANQIQELISSGKKTDMETALDYYKQRTVPSLIQIREQLTQLKTITERNLVSVDVLTEEVSMFRKTLLFYSLLTILFLMILGLQVFRVFKVFKHEVLDVVELSLEELTTYSSEIKANSTQMADGANQQAAGVEETSSSLEEMNSSTKQNVMRVSAVEEVMKELNQVMELAQRTLSELVQTMNEMKTAGAETKRINKSIEEIAFQTNLLALNAAVEAARAGQAGAGFAVVADEVRALAKRSSESAKSTEVIIDSVHGKIEQGSRLLTDTDSRFETIGAKFRDVDVMLRELTVSMSEQSLGIEQISLAVHDIDRITQSNAAGAEEHAATSDQIFSLAVAIQQRLKEIKVLISGE